MNRHPVWYVRLLAPLFRGTALLLLIGMAHAQQGLRLNINRQNATTFSTAIDYADTLQQGRYQGIMVLHHDHLLNTGVDGKPQFVQVYLRGDVQQTWRLSKVLRVASWIESDQFPTAGNQRISAYAGGQFFPAKGLMLMPLAGYSWDQRGGKLDKGFSPALRGRYQLDKEGLGIVSEAFIRAKYLQPRFQQNVLADTRLVRTFNPQASLETSLRLSSNQMDDYKRSSIEKIRADTLLPTLTLHYRPWKAVEWQSELSTALTRRSFRYARTDGGSAEFNALAFSQSYLRLWQEAGLTLKQVRASGSFGYEQTLRRYSLENDLGLGAQAFRRLEAQEQQKDFRQRLFQTDFSVNWQASPRHSLLATYQNRYIQYDTPSLENFDDHDELSHTGLAQWTSRWRKGLTTSTKLQASLRQYVFLFAQRSQENYTQRNLRLEFAYTWQATPRLLLTGEQFVYVTYNVKDFPDYTFTNRANRTLENRIKGLYTVGKRLNTSVLFYRKETHSSYLNWEAFAETPLDTALFTIGEWLWHWQPLKKSSAEVEVGYRHFSQFRYQNTGMTTLDGRSQAINLHVGNVQTGPVTGVKWQHHPHSVSCQVWWQWQRQEAEYEEIAGVPASSASWREADLLPRPFVLKPFVQLQVNIVR